ncbi:hypothetical protein D7Y36_10550 [Stenotrophomonas maltophilia]|nr:hypothetical protein [Stenotrophomonas maltophilia]
MIRAPKIPRYRAIVDQRSTLPVPTPVPMPVPTPVPMPVPTPVPMPVPTPIPPLPHALRNPVMSLQRRCGPIRPRGPAVGRDGTGLPTLGPTNFPRARVSCAIE